MFLTLCSPPVLEWVGQLVSDLIAHRPRDEDATRFRQRLQSRGDVDAIPVNIVVFNDYVAEIDPDAEVDPVV